MCGGTFSKSMLCTESLQGCCGREEVYRLLIWLLVAQRVAVGRGICMRGRLRQNDTNVSEIDIGRPIYISDVQYRYPTSDIYIRCPISISDVRYLNLTSDIYIRCPISLP